MTIEEYLTDVKRIYYQMSVIVDGKQILASGKTRRLFRLRNSLRLRFSTLSLPAATEVSKTGSDHAIIDFGGVHLVIWPVKEINDDV